MKSMSKIDEIGSAEYIRAHIQKLNERGKKENNRDLRLFDDDCKEMDKLAKQHMQEIGNPVRGLRLKVRPIYG